MPRYRYTGFGSEVFPTLTGILAPVLGSGELHPGDVIDLPEAVDHPRLELTDDEATPERPAPLETEGAPLSLLEPPPEADESAQDGPGSTQAPVGSGDGPARAQPPTQPQE